ncbi:acyltransferase family protein [Paraglaciecola sp. 20A4]|uniref:acyltransferase family protein n=1 Tax=Paraglaciecola sp. 20A4 TaxID=2687288 RepID=UPI001407293C|nr:acyltransferase family protein [Paraglaciecola sp. 20A4]
MEFRKDINGLRAIAVIAVVLFHFDASWMPGGFAGVDVFFVISGFLMTGIIFRGIEKESFSILKFYIARANRIIPALAILCLALLVFGWFYLTPFDYRALGKHVGSSLTFVSNFIYWMEAGYFDTASHEKWLLHTWSLSVEWQFYIIYPLVLVAMRQFMSLKMMKTAILLGSVFGFIFCVIATYQWPSTAYYLLHTRAWEMMIGGVAYLYPFSIQEKRKKLLEWIGLALIVSSYWLISKDNPWPGYLAIFPVFGSFLIIQAQRNNSFITSNIVFQKVGAWSYSIYLWHWPFVVAIYYYSLDSIFIYFGITLSILLGFLSYKYIEKIKFRNDFTSVFGYLKCKPVYFLCIIGFLGSVIFVGNGINTPIRSFASSEEAKYVSIYHLDNYKKYLPEAFMDQCNFFDVESLSAKVNDISEACTTNGKGGIFIWGDSHAQALSYGIRSTFPNVHINQVASSGCRPLIKADDESIEEYKRACDRSNEMAKNKILKIRPKVILLAQRIDHDKNDYSEILHYLHENKLPSKLILVGPSPQWQPSLPIAIARRHFNVADKVISDLSFNRSVLRINSQLHIDYDNSEIEYFSMIDQLCNKNGCLAKVDDKNTPLVFDYGHLSLKGSKYVVENMMKDIISSYL